MTSKALEAAALACRNFDRLKPVRVTAGESYEVEQSKLLAAAIIRAFAQNISEEATEAGASAAAQASMKSAMAGRTDLNAADRAGFISATEKDLE